MGAHPPSIPKRKWISSPNHQFSGIFTSLFVGFRDGFSRVWISYPPNFAKCLCHIINSHQPFHIHPRKLTAGSWKWMAWNQVRSLSFQGSPIFQVQNVSFHGGFRGWENPNLPRVLGWNSGDPLRVMVCPTNLQDGPAVSRRSFVNGGTWEPPINGLTKKVGFLYRLVVSPLSFVELWVHLYFYNWWLWTHLVPLVFLQFWPLALQSTPGFDHSSRSRLPARRKDREHCEIPRDRSTKMTSHDFQGRNSLVGKSWFPFPSWLAAINW